MAQNQSATSVRDEHYDLVSVLYHVLQGAQTNLQYLDDAQKAGDQEMVQFLQETEETYRKIGQQAKDLLKQRLA
jgi:uncharacterized protein YaaW (UPF0174 family)